MQTRTKLARLAVDEPRFALSEAVLAGGTQEIPLLDPEDARSRTQSTQLVIDQIMHPVIVILASGEVIAMNRLAESLVGCDREGLDCTELIQRFLHCPMAKGMPRDFRRQRRVEHVPAWSGAHLWHVTGRAVPVDVMVCPDADNTILLSCRPVDALPGSAADRDERVAAVGHDLKNPLGVIALELDVLRDAAPHERAVSLARIGKNVDLADRLVNDLVDLSALETARFELYRELLDLRGVVDDVVGRMGASHRIRCEAGPIMPVLVHGDGLRLERVLGNLLDNALKYSPSRAPVTIQVDDAGGRVRIAVTDHGPGLSEGDACSVFDKFRRAAPTRHEAGSGLGLYVSRRIVEAHGGSMGVRSSIGEGACFFFELPRAR